ncbi:MAG: ECF transporter S component [Syntrophobacterales bacterium]|nr:ECF transporter S component [Syntrophobacterales bacterium]
MQKLKRKAQVKDKYGIKLVYLVVTGIVVNCILSYLAGSLNSPIPVDHIATILVAILGGPVAGVLVGFFSALLSSLLAGYGITVVHIGNSINGAILGLLVGFFASYGWFKEFLKTVIVGICAALAYSFVLALTIMCVKDAAAVPGSCMVTVCFAFLDKILSVILVWVFLKLIGTALLENIAWRKANLTPPINTQKLGTKLAEIPVIGPIWKKLVRLITIFYLDYIVPLQKSDDTTQSTSQTDTLEEGQYMFNQYRGYSFRLPANIAEWSKVKVQLLIGTIQFAGANPDLINKETIAKDLNLGIDEVTKRVNKMYNDHLLLLPTDAALQTIGFGLFYMIIKLKGSVSSERKEEISNMIRDNDYICTSFETKGDYDFFVGAHIVSLDNLYKNVLKSLYALPELEELTLLPIQRMLRQERINHWDMKNEFWRETAIIDGEFEKLEKIQKLLDKTDLQIIQSMMKKKDVTEYLNVGFLSKRKESGEKLLRVLDEKRLFACPVFLNWMKLNYQPYFFAVKFDNKMDSDRKMALADELVENYPEFNIALQVNDTSYDLFLGTYQGLSDIKDVKGILQSVDEIVEVKEMAATRQHRMWTIKLEEKNWGECVMMWE